MAKCVVCGQGPEAHNQFCPQGASCWNAKPLPFASAIEARRAADSEAGAVGDESATATAGTPKKGRP